MRDDPNSTAISYARAAEILNVPTGTIRVWVHRGKLHKPAVCSGIGYLLEADVLRLEAERRRAAQMDWTSQPRCVTLVPVADLSAHPNLAPRRHL